MPTEATTSAVTPAFTAQLSGRMPRAPTSAQMTTKHHAHEHQRIRRRVDLQEVRAQGAPR